MAKTNDPVIETINTYNEIAEDFKKRYTQSDKSNTAPFLERFLKYLPEGKRAVLDIGSGAGFDAKYLYEHNCDVTSIDLSDRFLEIAKEVESGVNFLKMDIRSMTFDEGSFNGVWASMSLLHIEKKDIPVVLTNIRKILKPGGCVYIALKQGEGERFVVNKGEGNLANARRFFSFYSKEEFEKYLNNAGFEVREYLVNQNRDNVIMNFYCFSIPRK